MAAVFIIAGGVVGFVAAIMSVMVIEASLLAAFAIWMLVGLIFCCIGVILAATARAPAAVARPTVHTSI